MSDIGWDSGGRVCAPASLDIIHTNKQKQILYSDQSNIQGEIAKIEYFAFYFSQNADGG